MRVDNAAPRTAAHGLESVRARIHAAAKQLKSTFVERDDAIDAMVLAYVAGEHFLLIGDKGTSKTAVAKALASHVTGAKVFATLVGSFTTPDKVFGPLDIEAFKRGEYSTVTTRRLPWADIGWLDEVMKGSDGILNELLGVLNEREFDGAPVPLHTCGAATNWPEVESRSDRVAALYDRWLLRVAVEDLRDAAQVTRMLAAADAVRDYQPAETVTIAELRRAHAAAMRVKVPEQAQETLAKLRGQLAVKRGASGELGPGLVVSGRRLARLQNVMRASAWLAGRESVTVEDFAVLRWGLWEDRSQVDGVAALLASVDQEAVREAVRLTDEVLTAIRDASKDGSVGDAVFNRVTAVVRAKCGAARSIYDGPMLTAAGKAQVLTALRTVKEELERFEENCGRKS